MMPIPLLSTMGHGLCEDYKSSSTVKIRYKGKQKRMRPQGSLLTIEQTSRRHCKKGLKEWGGENRSIKGSRVSPYPGHC